MYIKCEMSVWNSQTHELARAENNELAIQPPSSQPLLTIAIPTYNRAANLALLLDMIAPQLENLGEIELFISDNSSLDDSEEVVRRFQANGLHCTYIRNKTNLGADGNFLQCYFQAAGKYFWLFGDDDVIFPGTLATIVRHLEQQEIDLVYLTPFGFLHSPNERNLANPDPGVFAFNDPCSFVHAVGLRGDFALISGIIVNKSRVESFPHPDFAEGNDTNLLQLGWTFTALRHFRRGLVFERGLFAVCEFNPQRQFDVVRVFGVNWFRFAQKYLEGHRSLFLTVIDDQLYSWFPTCWYGMRKKPEHTRIVYPVRQMRPLYGNRLFFWIFTWPLLVLPMPLAGAWLAAVRGIRHIDRFLNRRLRSSLTSFK